MVVSKDLLVKDLGEKTVNEGRIAIPYQERRILDVMRGSMKMITIRFKDDDVIELPCNCNYYHFSPEMNGRVIILRKVEERNPIDGTWKPYPSVSWIKENGKDISKAIVKHPKEGIKLMSSSPGFIDNKLVLYAKRAGVYIETAEGQKGGS